MLSMAATLSGEQCARVIERILAGEQDAYAEIVRAYQDPLRSALGGFVNADEITGMCPACNVDLVVVEGGEKKSVAYDTCESCGGIWIDSDEDEPAPELGWKDAEKQIVDFFRRFAKKK